jgi:hypothetical protein
MNIMWILLVILAVIFVTLLLLCSVIFLPLFLGSKIKSPISRGSAEYSFSREGEYQIETHIIEDAERRERFILYNPVGPTETLPVIVWGNGTAALPKNYDALHRHLASWGFLVMNTFNSETGTGEPLKEALCYLLEENEKPGGILKKHIDTERIGCAGHSQGSTGAINLHTNYQEGGYIKTVVSIALPALRWCDPEDVYAPEKISVPFLILTGTLDFIISPYRKCLAALHRLQSGVEGWFLEARYCAHTEIQGDGGKYRGILTAWFRYHLMEDETAREIFGMQGELYKNAGWRRVYKR